MSNEKSQEAHFTLGASLLEAYAEGTWAGSLLPQREMRLSQGPRFTFYKLIPRRCLCAKTHSICVGLHRLR
jgi:hypothetical protein